MKDSLLKKYFRLAVRLVAFTVCKNFLSIAPPTDDKYVLLVQRLAMQQKRQRLDHLEIKQRNIENDLLKLISSKTQSDVEVFSDAISNEKKILGSKLEELKNSVLNSKTNLPEIAKEIKMLTEVLEERKSIYDDTNNLQTFRVSQNNNHENSQKNKIYDEKTNEKSNKTHTSKNLKLIDNKFKTSELANKKIKDNHNSQVILSPKNLKKKFESCNNVEINKKKLINEIDKIGNYIELNNEIVTNNKNQKNILNKLNLNLRKLNNNSINENNGKLILEKRISRSYDKVNRSKTHENKNTKMKENLLKDTLSKIGGLPQKKEKEKENYYLKSKSEKYKNHKKTANDDYLYNHDKLRVNSAKETKSKIGSPNLETQRILIDAVNNLKSKNSSYYGISLKQKYDNQGINNENKPKLLNQSNSFVLINNNIRLKTPENINRNLKLDISLLKISNKEVKTQQYYGQYSIPEKEEESNSKTDNNHINNYKNTTDKKTGTYVEVYNKHRLVLQDDVAVPENKISKQSSSINNNLTDNHLTDNLIKNDDHNKDPHSKSYSNVSSYISNRDILNKNMESKDKPKEINDNKKENTENQEIIYNNENLNPNGNKTNIEKALELNMNLNNPQKKSSKKLNKEISNNDNDENQKPQEQDEEFIINVQQIIVESMRSGEHIFYCFCLLLNIPDNLLNTELSE